MPLMWHVSISYHTSPICVTITESGGEVEVCVCVTDRSLGFMGYEAGLPLPSPTIASDPGGQLSSDVGPLPASFSR